MWFVKTRTMAEIVLYQKKEFYFSKALFINELHGVNSPPSLFWYFFILFFCALIKSNKILWHYK